MKTIIDNKPVVKVNFGRNDSRTKKEGQWYVAVYLGTKEYEGCRYVYSDGSLHFQCGYYSGSGYFTTRKLAREAWRLAKVLLATKPEQRVELDDTAA